MIAATSLSSRVTLNVPVRARAVSTRAARAAVVRVAADGEESSGYKSMNVTKPNIVNNLDGETTRNIDGKVYTITVKGDDVTVKDKFGQDFPARVNKAAIVEADLSNSVAGALAATSLGWGQVFILLHACYFGIHYLFASQTAQVAALSTAFMAMMIASGAPPMLAGLTMAFHTNLFGAITHYASGQGAVYFGAGYVDLPTTFKLGGVLGVVNLLIWGVIGGAWWKFIGLY